MPVFKSLRIPLPPTTEQRAIAAALSDVNELIAVLDRLIAKKRDIKTAAMQQLLTGRTRLPGFEGEWETRRMGDLGFTYGGLTGKSKQHFGRGQGRYIPFLNVMNNVTIDSHFLESVDVSKGESQNEVSTGDLLFNTSSETSEELAMCSAVSGDLGEGVYLNSFCFGFRLADRANSPRFLAYWFRGRPGRSVMFAMAQGATRYNLSKQNFLQLEIQLPEPAEQYAIARVLSDVDAEIAALEARREKTKQIKQGMMQELLTGRTRLVQPRTSEAAAQVVEIADEVTNDETVEASASPPAPMRLVKGRGHNWTFDEAVVISCLSDRFATKQYPLGRERRTKFAYLLRRYDGQAPEGFLKKAAGPYNPRTKYGEPERIAREKGYVQEEGDYRGYVPGDNIEEARTYFVRWYGENALEWLERFRYFKTNELGALTTVDFAVLELRRVGQVVTVENVKQILAANKEWAPKLGQPQFTDERIRRSIRMSEELFGAAVPEEA